MSDFKAKMHQNRFRLGLRPRPRWVSVQRFTRPPELDLRGHTSKGTGRGRGRQGRERRGGEGKGGKEGGEWTV